MYTIREIVFYYTHPFCDTHQHYYILLTVYSWGTVIAFVENKASNHSMIFIVNGFT